MSIDGMIENDGIIERNESEPLFPMKNRNCHGVFDSKKGWGWLFAGTASSLIAAPWVLLGLGIFVLVMILMFYLALGKILGAVIIAAGVASIFKIRWWVGLIVVLLGVALFYNPYNLIPGLQMMW